MAQLIEGYHRILQCNDGTVLAQTTALAATAAPVRIDLRHRDRDLFSKDDLGFEENMPVRLFYVTIKIRHRPARMRQHPGQVGCDGRFTRAAFSTGNNKFQEC